jgi:ligand-binding sensor domain-containing protein
MAAQKLSKEVCRKSMKKLFIACLFLSTPLSSALALFYPIDKIDDAYIKRVVISPLDDNSLCVASRNSLFVSKDKGKTFSKLCVFKDEEISHIFFDAHEVNVLYLVTTRHFYRIKDKTEMFFNAPEESVILSTAKLKGKIYVGTSDGLYTADEDIFKWRKVSGLQEGISVYFIEPVEKNLYLATSRGIYILRENDVLERVYVLREKDVSEEEKSGITANVIKADIFDKDKVWVGTSRGIVFSKDRAKTWEKLYLAGIDSLNISSIAQTPLEKDTLYLAGPKGFFKVDLKNKISTQLFEGLSSCEVFWAAFSASGEIYLATSQGLFINQYFTASSKPSSVEITISKEPTIREIQEAAMRYNDTHPDKIRQWRTALRFRALFPTLSLDYDKTISVYQSSTVDRSYVGPRDWGVSFSWNVADLVWDTHQDDIDTRSRLNTQLRLDILDEINRVYFERLRLKKQIFAGLLPEEELFQKDLRLRELTAIIDGYTGGYFSKKSKELNER